MKILIITNNDSDGVGQHAIRLSSAFKKQGINSKTLVLHKSSYDRSVIKIKRSFFLRIFFYILNLTKKNINNLFSLGYTTVNYNMIKPHVDESDVIIIFSIYKILSFTNLKKIFKTKKLVYLRPLDLEFATGGCHVNLLDNKKECNNYKVDCKSCPLLNNFNFFDLSHKNFLIKKNIITSFNSRTFVENSYTQKIYNNSPIFKKNKTEVIYLGTNSERIKFIPKIIARNHLNLKNKDKIILFGSFNLDAKHKGGHLLKEALILMIVNLKKKNNQKKKFENIKLITIGNRNNFKIDIPNIEWLDLGLVKSNKKLNLLYRAADVLACPSINDNGPHIISEALSNDLPVVAFNQGLASETIINSKNGYLIPLYNIKEFGNSISSILYTQKKFRMDKETKKIKQLFDPEYEALSIRKYIKKDFKHYN